MDRLKLHGVVLRVVDYGESDRVVSLLTEERGKISAFARGARSSRKRFGGALEPFTLLSIEARERRGSDLLGLDSVNVTRGFGAIRGDLARIACAGYACDLTRELVRDAEPHPELLARLIGYLDRLDRVDAEPSALRGFELAALRAVGLMPRLTSCIGCGAAVDAEETVSFDPGQGGVVCDRCRAATIGASRLSAAALAALVKLQREPAPDLPDPLSRAVGVEIRDALSRFIEHHLGRRLASRKFLDEVAPLLGH
jgi:DNA repair protein RecO (recombination protein O)